MSTTLSDRNLIPTKPSPSLYNGINSLVPWRFMVFHERAASDAETPLPDQVRESPTVTSQIFCGKPVPLRLWAHVMPLPLIPSRWSLSADLLVLSPYS